MLIKVGADGRKALTNSSTASRCRSLLDEYQRGQLFSVCEASKNETGGGEGVEVVEQREFTSDTLRPGETLFGHVHGEDLPPALEDPLKDNFYAIVESMHVADDGGSLENALDLDEELLSRREVVQLDILDTRVLNEGDITPSTDPTRVASTRADRGPLQAGWAESGDYPVMCCYKVCQVKFKWFGLQTRAENAIQNKFDFFYPRLFTKFHREIYCWMDRWYELTLDDVRQHEEEVAEQLRVLRRQGRVRGMTANEE
ncbi:Phosphatidylinositol transfer protein alpha isoform [Aphelenchoides fujianensis]|nr:Phosphatidylinositol transfer protein alpha isoform [Aphelenchoides fujianensis]